MIFRHVSGTLETCEATPDPVFAPPIIQEANLPVLIGEPPRTQADLNFEIFGIQVRVHPFFWVVSILMGVRGSDADPVELLTWVCVVFFSILVHELGHALVIRRYGSQPWITLYAFGGLASAQRSRETARQSVLISLAGPGAGFALAATVIGIIAATGHLQGFRLAVFPIYYEPYQSQVGVNGYGPLDFLIYQLLWVNIGWGLLNLVPIYPLDGGQVARTVMVEMNPHDGIRQSLWISIITAVALAIVALKLDRLYITFMLGYLAYVSYATLQSYAGRGGGRGW